MAQTDDTPQMEEPREIYGNYGFVKVFRTLMDKAWYQKSDYVHLWLHLILKATHRQREYFWNGETITLQSGQFITGRRKLALETGINEQKVERILNVFESEQQIEQRKTTTSRCISIVNWSEYQKSEQPIEQPMNNKRTTDEQRMNTKQELIKNDKKVKKERVGKRMYGTTSFDEFLKTETDELARALMINLKKENKESEFQVLYDARVGEYKKFMEWIEMEARTVNRMDESFTMTQYYKLQEKFTKKEIAALVQIIHNKKAYEYNSSAYLTFVNWAKREYGER